MLKYFLCIVGLVSSFFMVKQREAIGDMLGEPRWTKAVGGIYYVVVYIAIIVFFWSIAELTNTTHLLFRPLEYLVPGLMGTGPDPDAL